MKSIIEYVTTDKVVLGMIFILSTFFQEAVKEIVHSIKIWIGFKSNISLALDRDNKIDQEIRNFVAAHDDVQGVTVFKVTNGGGIPKEGSPLNSGITHPTEKKHEWPVTEVSPFFRQFIQKVYNEKTVILPVEGIPITDPAYSYIRSQKETIQCLKMILMKETRKCRYIMSVRLTCTQQEYYANNKLREEIRRKVNDIRKYIS